MPLQRRVLLLACQHGSFTCLARCAASHCLDGVGMCEPPRCQGKCRSGWRHGGHEHEHEHEHEHGHQTQSVTRSPNELEDTANDKRPADRAATDFASYMPGSNCNDTTASAPLYSAGTLKCQFDIWPSMH